MAAFDFGLTPMGAALQGGLDTLDLNQSVTFTLYKQVIAPLDGTVFWINAELLSDSALLNTSALNTFQLNEPSSLERPPTSRIVKGSLHYATDLRQEQVANYSNNRVIFTAFEKVDFFNSTAPDELWIGTFDGIRFSFSSRASYFWQSNLHHYVGLAINADMESQIIDDPSLVHTELLIVSNSLPAFLAINRYAPVYPVPIPFPKIPLYPSFLTGLNLKPPFGSVHIEPDLTVALQQAPEFDRTMSSGQLCQDRVIVNLYGCTNAVAQDWLAAFYQYTLDTGVVGIAGQIGVVRDDKEFQTELLVLAQRKHIVMDISYSQFAMRDIARQLILEAFCTVIPTDTVIPVPVPT